MDRIVTLGHYLQARRRFTRWKTRAALEAWQEHRVQGHLRHLAERSPYFRERWNDLGADRWRDWPVACKSEMMAHFERWNTAGISMKRAFDFALEAERSREFSGKLDGLTVGLSSGTSGSRGLFLASGSERRCWAGLLLARILRGTLTQKHRAALFLRADSPLYHTVGSRRLQFAFFDLFAPLETHWERLGQLHPTILAAPPSVLVRLAMQPEAASLLAPPRILLSVADVLDASDRETIERGFQCDLGQIYQATEGFLAATCPFGKLHWNEDVVVVQKEWIDAARTRYVPILTDFRRVTQPVVRYRLDDVIVDDPEPHCPCGSIFGGLASIEGRCDDVLILPRRDGLGEVTVFPDFVRRALVMALAAGVDYTVEQVSPECWEIALSHSCPIEPIRQQVEDLCRQLEARVPELIFVNWQALETHRKRRRVRRREVT